MIMLYKVYRVNTLLVPSGRDSAFLVCTRQYRIGTQHFTGENTPKNTIKMLTFVVSESAAQRLAV